MFERHQGGERLLLVHIEEDSHPETREDLTEFHELARSTKADIIETLIVKCSTFEPRTLIGRGKVDELKALVEASNIELVIFNHTLSPGQERNLEKEFKCRVIDRTGLILDIFASRARSFEGKLQVELAQLQHLSTRLIRGWTHLERQKGGIGLRGPGETQLETDRRLLRERIKMINKRLARVQQQRMLSRRARKRVDLPTVALVGYTNAGKSSLFKALTESDTLVADQLFATLDPLSRRIDFPGMGHGVLIDTVGFIRHLPHDLIDAFSATLEETRDADLLLHIVDVANPRQREQVQEVNSVLSQINAEHVPQLMIYNKIDRVPGLEPRINNDQDGKPHQAWVSALTGDGMDELVQAIGLHLFGDPVVRSVNLPPSAGKLRAQLFELGAVTHEQPTEDGGWILQVRMSKRDYEALLVARG